MTEACNECPYGKSSIPSAVKLEECEFNGPFINGESTEDTHLFNVNKWNLAVIIFLYVGVYYVGRVQQAYDFGTGLERRVWDIIKQPYNKTYSWLKQNDWVDTGVDRDRNFAGAGAGTGMTSFLPGPGPGGFAPWAGAGAGRVWGRGRGQGRGRGREGLRREEAHAAGRPSSGQRQGSGGTVPSGPRGSAPVGG